MIIIDKNYDGAHKPLVAAIGFFDGVHIGHQFLIKQVKEEANANDLASSVITFPVHPRKILESDYQPALLCSYGEKLEHLAQTGLDYCISLDFSIEISKLTAREFMQKILKDQFNISTLLIGYDHRFGHNRTEGLDEYKKYGDEIGIKVIQAKQLPGEKVSSSRIRQLLSEGDVRKAAELLSYRYSISGKVVEGFMIGRTIGFPTANIKIWEKYKVIPALGIYAVYAFVEDKRYDAMLYIGTRPTLHKNGDISLEVNLFDFDGDLYGKDLRIEFVEFIRHDKKFESIDSLRNEIMKDKETAIFILKNNGS